ncbi:family 13 alpha amylase in complex with acarbose [Aspergillus campestris IBT 28561]|uniref:Alpha-amylase n=1 Tax=Aspergillus campestris (strain IBT 28561) TaxID=1392248 RepID=A0A2I1CYJ7_ASPC2|nr:family 13 alpha amylase in complex with acarbose [Aspergillus campestris IBT 28561]PKY02692.1 family 13 alpha amylase in complex with acarbose [Aspergillus campestris IBT 28561]
MRLSLWSLLLGTTLAATPAEWKSQSIYFLLTDRFARTDGSTEEPCDTEARKYCGGTWQGIIKKLDYIQDMGFTAIWITPVTSQIKDTTEYGEAYHGYWQQDINSLEEHYGKPEDLTALSDALHERGMYLMVDVVANHMGYKGAGDAVDYSIFTPFNKQEYFHDYCPIKNYDDPTQSEQCWLGDNKVALPDLNTESEEVKNIWYKWVGDLVKKYKIDGLRIDTVKHVQKDFWKGYNEAAGVYCVGEVLDGDVDNICSYQEVMDGLLNYPIYYPLINAFKAPGGSMSELASMITTVQEKCKDVNLLGSFVDNHDNPRFASYTKDVALAKNIAAYSILADGIPIIYAGQEQHFSGGEDPANREATWTGGYDTEGELYKVIAASNKVRNLAIKQDEKYVDFKTQAIFSDDSSIAIRKGADGSQIITVLTNKGEGGEATVEVTGTGYESGTELTDVITCSPVKAGDNGSVSVPLKGGAPAVLYPTKKLADSKICA